MGYKFGVITRICWSQTVRGFDENLLLLQQKSFDICLWKDTHLPPDVPYVNLFWIYSKLQISWTDNLLEDFQRILCHSLSEVKVYCVVSDFLMNKIKFCWRRQVFANFQTWLPQVWRKCFLSNFSTHKMCVGKYFPLQFSIFVYGWYYYHTCRQMLLPYFTKHTLFCGRGYV